MKYPYGYFDVSGKEFVITDPSFDGCFDNFLWNNSIFSNVQHTGVGYSDYQIGDCEGVQLMSGVGRICDFDVFGRSHLMSRLIYVLDRDTGKFFNVNWEPVRSHFDTYTCRHGLGYSIIHTIVDGIEIEFKIFVPKGNDPVELWEIKVKSVTGNKRNLAIFLYNQIQLKYKWGFDSYGDMIFRGTRFNSKLNALLVEKHPYLKPHNYLTAFITANRTIDAYDGSQNAFVGRYNTLAAPQALIKGGCFNSNGSSEGTISALMFNVDLEKEEESIQVILGAVDSENALLVLKERYLDQFEIAFYQLLAHNNSFFDRWQVTTPDDYLNVMSNYWIKQGVRFGAQWCRWGWNGYRDLVQHGLGVVTLDPFRTCEILEEAFRHQFQSGLAVRGWNPIDEKPYSDSALWLVFTLIAYIKETGDMGFLSKEMGYYDGGVGSVLEHIERALEFLHCNQGQHSLCLIKYGDWNDSLTAVGKEGRGESVWLSQAYVAALEQMADLMVYLTYYDRADVYKVRIESMTQAIENHAWNGNWYRRCYDDQGYPIGDSCNQEGQIFLETQAWGLLSGVARHDQVDALLKACDNRLMTPHGYALLAPTFTKRDDHIGRISCLEPGVCENGTVYSHVNAWMILGLIRYNRPDEAYKLLKKIAPGYIEESNYKVLCPPYMFANCYYGMDHKREALKTEFNWITGSLSWYNQIVMEGFAGVRSDYTGLSIRPCMPSEWTTCEVSRVYKGATYNIHISRDYALEKKVCRIMVDGQPLKGSIVPAFADGAIHEVQVHIG